MILSLAYPSGIPFFIFLGVVAFMFSDQAKNLFDLEKWENEAQNQKDEIEIKIEKPEKTRSQQEDDSATSLSSFMNNNANGGGSFILLGIIGFILISVVSDGFVSIPAGSTGVVFDKGRGVLDDNLDPGMHLKIPFWQEVSVFTTAKQVFTMDDNSDRKSDKELVRGRSKDLQDVFVDVSVTYKVKREDAPFLLKEFKTESAYKKSIVFPAARSAVYDTIGQFKASEIVSEKREEFTNLLQKKLSKVYGDNKIQLEEVFVRNVSFSDEYKKVIEANKVEEENIKIEAKRTEKAEQIKKQQIIKAEGEAEAMRLRGAVLKDYPNLVQLQFVEKMAPNISWGISENGAVPIVNPENLKK